MPSAAGTIALSARPVAAALALATKCCSRPTDAHEWTATKAYAKSATTGATRAGRLAGSVHPRVGLRQHGRRTIRHCAPQPSETAGRGSRRLRPPTPTRCMFLRTGTPMADLRIVARFTSPRPSRWRCVKAPAGRRTRGRRSAVRERCRRGAVRGQDHAGRGGRRPSAKACCWSRTTCAADSRRPPPGPVGTGNRSGVWLLRAWSS